MHIKQVTIQGFRSYRDPTACEQFSKRHNIVVGRNGSGKSNFFTAIQFVLSDDFSNLRTEQRVSLLHEGTGPRVISACVELLFDNSDKRLPIQKDEVSIRRVIGQKKDQYFLDKKITTKKDVVQLFEAAGFSRSNPYYIVKQGKINEMATQSEKDRLELFKEVAGTRVYDDKRSESMELIKKTEDSHSKIVAVLSQIVDKLESLEQEKEELTQYQRFDKERRALEYLLFDRDRNEAETKLQKLKIQRENHRENKQEIRRQAEEAARKLAEGKRKLAEVNNRLSRENDERETNTAQKDKIIGQLTQVKLTIDDLELSVSEDTNAKDTARKQHEQLRRQIFEKRAELDELQPTYMELTTQEKSTEREKNRAERRRDELYAKQGRQNRFNDQDQRDAWLRGEIEKVNASARRTTEALAKEKDEMERLRRENQNRNDQINRCRQDMQQYKSEWDRQNEKALQLKRKKEDLVVEQNEFWRKETALAHDKQQFSTELRNKDSQLQGMIGRSILNGIKAINEVRKQFQQQERHDLVEGYLGTLIDCFSTEQSFFTAVEVTASSRLFHHVVSTSAIGNSYLQEMNRMKLQGEVTFLPLDRLQAKREKYPKASDALPLIDKINFEPEYEIVMLYVFGKTLICRNMEVATRFAREHGLDCITLDGDQVSRRGALTGGYIDTKRSRLELHHNKLELRRQMAEKEEEYNANRAKLSGIDEEINRQNREIQNLETELNKCKELYDRHSAMFSHKSEEYRHVKKYLKSVDDRQAHITRLQSQQEQFDSERTSFESELGSSMASQLTPDEHQELHQLNAKIQESAKKVDEITNKRIEVEQRKNRIETLLSENLCKREEALKRNMDQLEDAERKSKLQEARDQYRRLEQQNEDIAEREIQIREEINTMERDQAKWSELVDKYRKAEVESQERLINVDKDYDKMASKESLYLEKSSEAQQKLCDLGAVPTELIDRYQDYSTKQIYKKLEDANRHLKKYSHVNKKALDQFMSFSEERKRLEDRRDEMNSEAKKINELIVHLDDKKYETINMTFEKISDNFSAVFKKLVPQGKASLELIEADTESQSKVDKLVGISIKVSFTGKAAETREMSQLSGGQKSMVALTLIFAIQKCDPVPFYLFDEIDQALDPAHRRAVANMMNEMKHDAQFITTTFRPELLEAGDKYYGVTYRNKVSHVETITKEDALDFVGDDEIQQ